MRLLWHSHSPAAPTGYGTPTALWLPVLRDMGHEVTCSAFQGHPAGVTSYEGIPVLDSDDGRFGATRLRDIAATVRPDVIVTLMDIWALPLGVIDALKIPAVNWIPVDTSPLSVLDERYYRRSRAFPVAMSEHGGRMLAQAGFGGAAIPYAYDPAVFHPGDREAARRDAGLDGVFAVGINAAPVERKAWPEQLEAYARLWREHPGDVILTARTTRDGPIPGILRTLGLPPEAIRWTGGTGQTELASWYRALDVLSACSYAEGFCLPVLEAQACGTPVITTDAPPVSTEAGLPGRHVTCEPMWNPMHNAWWHRPSVTAIHEALEAAYADSDRTAASAAAVAHARNYAVSEIAPRWAALLEERAAAGCTAFTFQLRQKGPPRLA